MDSHRPTAAPRSSDTHTEPRCAGIAPDTPASPLDNGPDRWARTWGRRHRAGGSHEGRGRPGVSGTKTGGRGGLAAQPSLGGDAGPGPRGAPRPRRTFPKQKRPLPLPGPLPPASGVRAPGSAACRAGPEASQGRKAGRGGSGSPPASRPGGPRPRALDAGRSGIGPRLQRRFPHRLPTRLRCVHGSGPRLARRGRGPGREPGRAGSRARRGTAPISCRGLGPGARFRTTPRRAPPTQAPPRRANQDTPIEAPPTEALPSPLRRGRPLGLRPGSRNEATPTQAPPLHRLAAGLRGPAHLDPTAPLVMSS